MNSELKPLASWGVDDWNRYYVEIGERRIMEEKIRLKVRQLELIRDTVTYEEKQGCLLD